MTPCRVHGMMLVHVKVSCCAVCNTTCDNQLSACVINLMVEVFLICFIMHASRRMRALTDLLRYSAHIPEPRSRVSNADTGMATHTAGLVWRFRTLLCFAAEIYWTADSKCAAYPTKVYAKIAILGFNVRIARWENTAV